MDILLFLSVGFSVYLSVKGLFELVDRLDGSRDLILLESLGKIIVELSGIELILILNYNEQLDIRYIILVGILYTDTLLNHTLL